MAGRLTTSARDRNSILRSRKRNVRHNYPSIPGWVNRGKKERNKERLIKMLRLFSPRAFFFFPVDETITRGSNQQRNVEKMCPGLFLYLRLLERVVVRDSSGSPIDTFGDRAMKRKKRKFRLAIIRNSMQYKNIWHIQSLSFFHLNFCMKLNATRQRFRET